MYKSRYYTKHNIPIYYWNESKEKRRLTVVQTYEPTYVYLAPEDYMHSFYKTFSKEGLISKHKYYYRFINKKFPYRVNTYYKDLNILNNSYFRLLNSGL